MILYQLTINGVPFGTPKPEWVVDKMISRSRTAVSGELEKVIIKPELKVIGGQAYADDSSERISANA
ncbi:hypothetical protein QFZ77_002438 [Paenibacillus sp. V4I3]|uniref:hypothetical protein n=1 Tax=Paenibacillus sp. V4I3 TaxID=3042305 RepID=UPI00277D758C|nr:hypothetical protein [Paenibacillus sp. V4I3]MDQ0873779.1 hypothetical protein [Paenibacillus sp. V4I3]